MSQLIHSVAGHGGRIINDHCFEFHFPAGMDSLKLVQTINYIMKLMESHYFANQEPYALSNAMMEVGINMRTHTYPEAMKASYANVMLNIRTKRCHIENVGYVDPESGARMKKKFDTAIGMSAEAADEELHQRSKTPGDDHASIGGWLTFGDGILEMRAASAGEMKLEMLPKETLSAHREGASVTLKKFHLTVPIAMGRTSPDASVNHPKYDGAVAEVSSKKRGGT